MTNSASSLLAILLGLGVFAIVMAVGWRSVQNRRILRLQDPDGHETIIIAREDDEISSVVTSTSEAKQTAPASPGGVVESGPADPNPATEFGRRATESEMAADVEADDAAHDRLSRVVSSTK